MPFSQRGATIRDLVAELAQATPTREELVAQHAAATAYLREHLSPDLGEDDATAGEWFWTELEAGRPPSSLAGTTPEWTGAPPTRSMLADPPPTGRHVLTTTPEIYSDWGINTISVT